MTTNPATQVSIRTGYYFTSPAMKFGKTFWRFVVLPSRHSVKIVTDYEWLNTDYSDTGVWYPAEQWRSYNHNDGTYAGLPRSLRKLWERYNHEYERLNGPTGARH
jgi:hypothetical protein